MKLTQKKTVLSAQCAHARSNHVRSFALKRVVSVYNSFNLLTTTSGEFWKEYGCCLLRVQILLMGGVRRQLGEVGGCSAADVSAGGDVLRRQHKEMKQGTRSIVTLRRA